MNEELENHLQVLREMEQQTVSPFLETRIMASIAQNAAMKIPLQWIVSALAGIAILLVININVLKKTRQNTTPHSMYQTIVGMEFSTSNQLYNE